ncbi:chaplin family protein [Streptomyces noursei]|uniref:chaplin family protein n=1 Tax=Streptomyces noursei TaxID=1971 RepID=UPI0005CA1149|nr:chaplin family protein [Streptomyces noursei]
MSVETRGSGSAVGAGVRAAVVGAMTGVALLPAGAAQANVIGIGNAVFGNTCVNQGGARAVGSTVAGSGVASGNYTGLPLSLPRNHCGNSGIVCTAVFMSSV